MYSLDKNTCNFSESRTRCAGVTSSWQGMLAGGSGGGKAEVCETARNRRGTGKECCCNHRLQPWRRLGLQQHPALATVPPSTPSPSSAPGFLHAENVFVLPVVFTSGCWRREGLYFVFNSSRSSVLIDTCQGWAVKAGMCWAECRNVCRRKDRAGWFCFKNKIKAQLKFTHGPWNKNDKLQPRG